MKGSRVGYPMSIAKVLHHIRQRRFVHVPWVLCSCSVFPIWVQQAILPSPHCNKYLNYGISFDLCMEGALTTKRTTTGHSINAGEVTLNSLNVCYAFHGATDYAVMVRRTFSK